MTAEAFPTHRVDVEALFTRQLPAMGLDVELVMQASSPDIGTGLRTWNQARVNVGPTTRGAGAMSRAWRQLLEFAHDLRCVLGARRRDHDAIQVRDKCVIGVIAVIVARLRRLRFYFWLSFPIPESDIANARAGRAFFGPVTLVRGLISARLLYGMILPSCDHAFVQSAKMKANLVARGIDAGKLTPVPMGVDLTGVESLPAARAIDSHGPVTVGYLGGLEKARRLGTLIDTIALLRDGGMDARLLLIGDALDPRDRVDLVRQAQERHIADRVEITGMLPRSEALRRALSVDIAISPIHRSPIFDVASPTKLVEYLAMGLPVVANSQPEQREILRSSRAGVCTPWGARHFARAIRWLAACPPEIRDTMRIRGKQWVDAHRTYELIGAEVSSVYRRIAASGTKP
ncbi:MAG: glycosyltransferase [Steroidobacteraceae bacterium]